MADLTSLNVQLQKFLQDEGHYKGGALDGKMGPQTHKAVLAIMKEYGISTTGWTKSRSLIALEQLYYKSLKIEVGSIDGKVGPQTRYAREVFESKQTTTWRDTADKIAEVVQPKPVVTIKSVSSLKWPTQAQCTSFYGKVGTNQVQAIMPYPLRLSWDLKTKVTKFSCHKLVKESIERVFNRTIDYYGYEKIKELRLDLWGGCLNVRKMRGGSSYSMHSWGIAIDMDPDRNQLNMTWKQASFSKSEYKIWNQFWYDEGAINLGIERNYDSMHYQFARLS